MPKIIIGIICLIALSGLIMIHIAFFTFLIKEYSDFWTIKSLLSYGLALISICLNLLILMSFVVKATDS